MQRIFILHNCRSGICEVLDELLQELDTNQFKIYYSLSVDWAPQWVVSVRRRWLRRMMVDSPLVVPGPEVSLIFSTSARTLQRRASLYWYASTVPLAAVAWRARWEPAQEWFASHLAWQGDLGVKGAGTLQFRHHVQLFAHVFDRNSY